MLKVGDRVKLSEQGIKKWCFDDFDVENPKGSFGTFVRPFGGSDDFLYEVLWDNGLENDYQEGDLDVVEG